MHRLQAFSEGGYAFDSAHRLREGTQQEAFDAYARDFAASHRQGYIELPTGVGKTALFTAVVKNYLDAANGTPDPGRVLIVVPTEKLAVQTAQAFAKFLPEMAPTIEADDDRGREIDWQNSQIGLQYSKAKHAERKPRVLITTYQSLVRDRDNRTYPPDEYDLVIFDEGHAITAPRFGEAVEKFKDAVQLAVTATPEYSPEKNVTARLPHCYYRLALAEAINRGDLCNVRPILLKTNYTVDAGMFAEFLRRKHGHPLTDRQVETLLNQEARNNAAIQTYLLGRDPDSGERYLGQSGMVFGGGTDHVDDLVRQFHKVLDQPNYHPIREWLDQEGLELIAPVHGKVKGAWLRPGLLATPEQREGKPLPERERQGSKEWYSEEEILDLHAEGKILLLASVKKLKEGYDCPRDSLIIDLVDRCSKVDAAQVLGRGFRLNPPDPANNDPGDPEKTCTVINLVDNNTYEIYKDVPQMLPIYCAEIIEGAEYRTPARRPHLLKSFKKEPPDLQLTLAQAGFEIEADIEKVRAVSRKHQEDRARGECPLLPADKPHWLSPTELCKAIRLSASVENIQRVNAACEAILAERDKRFFLPASHDGKLCGYYPASEFMGKYRKHSRTGIHTDPRAAEIVCAYYGIPPLLPKHKHHFIAASEACLALDLDRTLYKERIDGILQELQAQPTVYRLPADAERHLPAGEFATNEVMGIYRKHTHTKIYFDPRLLPIIHEKLGFGATLPGDKQHWLPRSIALKKLGIEPNTGNNGKFSALCNHLLQTDSNAQQWMGIYFKKRVGRSLYINPDAIRNGYLTKDIVLKWDSPGNDLEHLRAKPVAPRTSLAQQSEPPKTSVERER